MTNQILDKIRNKYLYLLSEEHFAVYDKETNKEICPICPIGDIKLILERLGLEKEEDFRQLVEDVREGRNRKYKILFNCVDVRDANSKDASSIIVGGKHLTRHENYDYHVMSDLRFAIEDEIHNMESYLVLPKDKRIVPKGFADWDDFKSYYKALVRWLHRSYNRITFKLPPMRDNEVKIEHSGAWGIYQTPSEKIAQVGCGIIGAGWFAFIGISFVACVLMWIGGCMKGCSLENAYSEGQLERILH